MPSPEQMENDVREVLEYCRNYRGPHEEVFAALREHLREIDQPIDESDDHRRERIAGMFREAVSTLLFLVDPPGQDAYERVLGGIAAVTGTPITAARFHPEAPFEAAAAIWEPYDLRDSLPGDRVLTAGQREVLDSFRSQLSAAEASDTRFGEN